MKTKNELRKKAKEIRNSLDMASISAKIAEKILNLNEYKKARHIMLFYPLKNEINLLKLLEDESKIFYLPKVAGENLLACPYQKGDELSCSKFNTQEPASEPIKDLGILDLILIPALMVDKENYRLGYGGGFYDRFLEKVPNAIKIVPIPSALITEKLPIESFDRKVDVTVCEKFSF